jgi:hypothetical protein
VTLRQVIRPRGFRNHLIFYRPTSELVEFLRVLHGARTAQGAWQGGTQRAAGGGRLYMARMCWLLSVDRHCRAEERVVTRRFPLHLFLVQSQRRQEIALSIRTH